jgi:hypothetical protein
VVVFHIIYKSYKKKIGIREQILGETPVRVQQAQQEINDDKMVFYFSTSLKIIAFSLLGFFDERSHYINQG